MPYMGIQELKDANVKSGSATGDGSTTTFAIGWTPPSAGSLFVTINGVLQSASAYSISASNCVFTAAPVSADAIEFKGIQSSGTVVTLGDGVVNAAQLGSSSVVTASIVDNNVTTAKILDNNVTLAKMAGLARGKIIVGDSSGDPTALALGTSTQVLTSDGSDAAWAAAALFDATPRWLTYVGTSQSLSNNSNTEFEYDTEVYDSDSAFDTGTYKFTVPVGEAGVYFGYCSAYHAGSVSGAHQQAMTQLIMGGTSFWAETNTNNNFGLSFSVGAYGLAVLAEGDTCYIKGKSIFSSGTVHINQGQQESFFGGWRVA